MLKVSAPSTWTDQNFFTTAIDENIRNSYPKAFRALLTLTYRFLKNRKNFKLSFTIIDLVDYHLVGCCQNNNITFSNTNEHAITSARQAREHLINQFKMQFGMVPPAKEMHKNILEDFFQIDFDNFTFTLKANAIKNFQVFFNTKTDNRKTKEILEKISNHEFYSSDNAKNIENKITEQPLLQWIYKFNLYTINHQFNPDSLIKFFLVYFLDFHYIKPISQKGKPAPGLITISELQTSLWAIIFPKISKLLEKKVISKPDPNALEYVFDPTQFANSIQELYAIEATENSSENNNDNNKVDPFSNINLSGINFSPSLPAAAPPAKVPLDANSVSVQALVQTPSLSSIFHGIKALSTASDNASKLESDIFKVPALPSKRKQRDASTELSFNEPPQKASDTKDSEPKGDTSSTFKFGARESN